MGYRVKGTLKLPDGTPGTNCEIEFKSRKNFTPMLTGMGVSILTDSAGAYDVTLEYGAYAVILRTGNTYPSAIGQLTVGPDTAAGQDLPTLLEQSGWQPATPEYITAINSWLEQAETAASNAAGSVVSAKAEADRAKSEADRAKVITGLGTVEDAVAAAAVPFPDVWIPLNDSLNMLAGYGTEVKVGTDVVARKVDFTRASTATYIDKSGVLRTAAINEPRFEKEGLLIEGQSTNLVPWSSDFSKYSSGPTVTTPDADGFTLFDLDIVTYYGSSSTLTIGTTYTVSALVDVSGPCTIQIGFGGQNRQVEITEAMRGVISHSIECTSTSGSLVRVGPRIRNAGVTVKIRYLQLEALPFATSYIPTNGAAATRASDVVTLNGINMPIGVKTLATNFTCTVNEAARHSMTIFREEVYSASNRQTLAITPAGKLNLNDGDGAIDSVALVTSKQRQIGAAVFNGPSSKLALNGVVSKTQRVPITTNSRIYQQNWRIGDNFAYSSPIYGHIRNFRIWHTDLTDAQIKGLK